MISKIRLPQTLIPVSIVAVTMLGAVLLFPTANSASSGQEKQAPSAQKEHHNRLMNESSPYLLQHATNPVNWYPWNEEAFVAAKREDKPIFLSIGYSTCHWCHVMAHESFSDHEVADLLNKDFISIKVDREERPDIDHVYMTVTQALTGSGGWPMTIIMTPDKRYRKGEAGLPGRWLLKTDRQPPMSAGSLPAGCPPPASIRCWRISGKTNGYRYG